MEPSVTVVIASERVNTLLAACLNSLRDQAEDGWLEAVVASAEPPPRGAVPPHLEVRWAQAASRNPARRRNLAAREARGAALAFLDDDAEAEPGWAEAGLAALREADVAGGPDLGPRDAPYGERLSDLLLATPWIGSGVPAHEWNPRGGPVRSPHDVALCNLFVRRETFERLGGFDESFGYIGEDTDFVRRAMDSGARVVLDPRVRVRHRRRAFPGPYLAQRWRYRVKTGRLLVERPGLHARGRVTALLAAGFAVSAGAALFGARFLVPAAACYALLTWACASPIWRRDLALFPAVPFAFAAHHATYFAGLLAGISRGVFSRRPRVRVGDVGASR
ncbi:MAG TPA: glycosyltransferase family 2 protein [Thermoanaerobaculia bacterium]